MKKAIVLFFLFLATYTYGQGPTDGSAVKKLLNRANAAIEMKDVEGAIEEYKKAQKLEPRNTLVLQKLGGLYEQTGNYGEAVNCYNSFLAIAPDAPEAAYIETKRDKLEYKFDKANKTEKDIATLKGNWRTIEKYNGDKYYFIFNIDELEGDTRITLSPNSAMYDENILSKTTSAKRIGNKLNFAFSTDKNFDPQKEQMDNVQTLGSMADISSGLGLGELGGVFGFAAKLGSVGNAGPAYNDSKNLYFSVTLHLPDSIVGYCKAVFTRTEKGQKTKELNNNVIKFVLRKTGTITRAQDGKDIYEASYENGYKYKGEVKANEQGNTLPEGKGILTDPKGNTIEGEFKNGKAHGHCIAKYTTGYIYDGGFKKGKRDGRGKFTWTNGDVYTGTWSDGKRDGKGEFTFGNGDNFSCKWEEGKILDSWVYTDTKGKETSGIDLQKLGDEYKNIKGNVARVLQVQGVEMINNKNKEEGTQVLKIAKKYAEPGSDVYKAIDEALKNMK